MDNLQHSNTHTEIKREPKQLTYGQVQKKRAMRVTSQTQCQCQSVYTLDIHWQCTLCIHCSGARLSGSSIATLELHWVHYSVCTVYTASVCPVYTLITLDFGLGSQTQCQCHTVYTLDPRHQRRELLANDYDSCAGRSLCPLSIKTTVL